MVELVFFLFGGVANLLLECRVAHDNKVPGLQVGAARRFASRQDAIFNDLSRNMAVGELSDCAPPAAFGVKLLGTSFHFLSRIFQVIGKRYESTVPHFISSL